MMKYRNSGHSIYIDLDQEDVTTQRYKDYCIDCLYHYSKNDEKYIVSMWLRRKDIDDRFKIDFKVNGQLIDTQPLSGTKENIRENICRVVEYMATKTDFFDKYIDRFEYTYKCFDIGDDVLEKEGMDNVQL